MDDSQLKAAGFNDAEIRQYNNLKAAGFNDREIEDYYAKKPSPTTITTEERSGIGRFIPEGLQEQLQGAKEAVATAAPVVGTIAGGMAGAAAPIPGGAIIGAGLGAGAGEAASRFLKGDKRGTPLEEISRTGKDIVGGTGAEVGGQIVSKGIGVAIEKMSPLAEKLYGFAIRTPVTEKWKKLFPGAEGTAREEAVKAGLKSEILPNPHGLQVATSRANELTNSITNLVDRITKEGRGGNINVYDLTGEARKKIGRDVWASSDTEAAQKATEGIMEGVIKKAGPTAKLSPNEVLDLKRQFDAEIAWDKAVPIMDIKGQFTHKARMAIRDSAMRTLENIAPELKYLNKETAAYIDLKEALEHSIAREANADPVGFASKILAIKSMALGALDSFLGISTNRARLAFAMNKGALAEARNVSRLTAMGGIGAVREDNQPTTIIRYDSHGARMTK